MLHEDLRSVRHFLQQQARTGVISPVVWNTLMANMEDIERRVQRLETSAIPHPDLRAAVAASDNVVDLRQLGNEPALPTDHSPAPAA